MKDRKVNLFVVGAMKAGTTSFMEILSKHPEIYTCPVKEPNYFIDELPPSLYEPSRFFSLDNYFKNDFPKPLHIAKVEKTEHYQRLFTYQNGEKYLAEGSTLYLHAPQAARRLYNYNPEARIIIICRNPISRTFSHYKMQVGLGRETRDFQEVIKEELRQYQIGELPWYGYLSLSFYNKPIASYKSLFRHVHVISFEDLLSEKERVMNGIASFLELSEIDTTEMVHANVTRSLRFKSLFRFLKKIGVKDYFSAIFGTQFKHKLFQLASKAKSEPMNLSQEIHLKLEQLFKKESRE